MAIVTSEDYEQPSGDCVASKTAWYGGEGVVVG